MNLFLKEENKINPLIDNAGVSAVPDSACVSQIFGLQYDKTNHLLMARNGTKRSRSYRQRSCGWYSSQFLYGLTKYMNVWVHECMLSCNHASMNSTFL